MYNDLFSIGPFTFHTYGLMTAIGIIAAYLLMARRAKQNNFTEEQQSKTFGLILFCLIFGYLGSKILYILTILPRLREDPAVFLQSLSGGWVVFGGLLGGVFGAWLFCRWQKLSVGKYFDLAFPAVALAQAFGRVGCFFAGCCYGVETDSAFSIVFQHSQYAPNHVHLVPTQLISAVLDLALCLFLLWYEKNKEKYRGELAALYLILYSAGRFVLEFWRGDLIRGAVGPLSTSQFIGLFTLLAGIILLMLIRGKKGEEA
ncbi:MAG: prolipoprotein diacylglyceryl transferase [Eubacterium sp.]|nr:prolipoprotein diacylglyceryl transferase [Eubacterium sp.]